MFNPFLTLGFQILSFCHMLLAFYFKIVEMFTYVYFFDCVTEKCRVI